MITFRPTELGNAERLAATYGEALRYVRAWGTWLVWDERRWRRDDVGVAMAAAKQVVRDMFAEAAELAKAAATGNAEAGDQAAKLTKWGQQSSRAAVLRATASIAETEPPIASLPDHFDRDPFAFNVQNGTVDLRTGALRPHRMEDLITRLSPVHYDPSATAPIWERFLARVLPDPDLRGFVQRFAGYCLTGDVREQCLAFFHGRGANGKSTFLELLMYVMGEYSKAGAPDLLLAKKGEAHPTEQADLHGARLVVCQETEAGRQWAERTVKALTGGDQIKARFMRCDFFQFDPTHKLIVSANHKPRVRGQDHAIWRRIKLVPFDVTIPDEEKDAGLPVKLRAEAPGILAWAVRGCLEWQRRGLGGAAAVSEATADYRREQDHLGHYLEDECVLDAGAFEQTATLYDRYRAWCGRTGEHAWERPNFREGLCERGLEARKGTKGVRGFGGVRLRGPGE